MIDAGKAEISGNAGINAMTVKTYIRLPWADYAD
jgi:hypothetical protein